MILSELSKHFGTRPEKYKLGIALGGGGARGFMHLGVIKALNEKGLMPEIISGTSAGSIAGCLIADGHSPEEVHRLLKDKDFFGLSKFQWPKDGLFNLDGLTKILKGALTVENIEETKIPFVCTLTNLNSGAVAYLDNGPLVESVTASASIPFIFRPVSINGQKFVDGGVLDNLPVKPLIGICEKLIAVSISPLRENNDLDSLVKVASRTFQLGVNAQNRDIQNRCDLFIEPDNIDRFDFFNNSDADKLFELGYEYTIKLDTSILEL